MSRVQSATRLRADCATLLYQILEDGRSSRQLLADKQARYQESRDKAWLQEMTFGCLRQLPTLQFWLRQLLKKPLKGSKKVVEHLLMVGLYQLAFSRVSDHAAISETVNACKVLKAESLKGLANAILREFQRSGMQEKRPDNPAALAGFSNWIYQAIIEHYPNQAEHIVEQTNTKAPLWLRVNQAQITRTDFSQKLAENGIEHTMPKTHNDAIVLSQFADVTTLPGYSDGYFAVQDGAAQLAAHYIDPQAGERILDCCAAPGGKTCHIIEKATNIECVAIDNDQHRLKRVHENLKRLKHNATVICADASAVEEWWDGKLFDRILLDAPCSATGVIRRHPDIRWLRKKTDIAPLLIIQATLLDQLWQTLKPGGVMLYATCSILPSENDEQIKAFLAKHDDATIDTQFYKGISEDHPGRQILPGEEQMDGFYYARLLKSE